MPRYIDAEKFYEALSLCVTEIEIKLDAETDSSKVLKAVQNGLINFPTADVAPVLHAHWIVQKKPVYISSAEYPLRNPTKLYIPDFYNCSICGRREPYQEPYCHCGAKMDEEVKEDAVH